MVGALQFELIKDQEVVFEDQPHNLTGFTCITSH